jgi:tRNA/tmRNA/rRNA uracil-C5-methylase (TrmA/RlmC/RlmD family)
MSSSLTKFCSYLNQCGGCRPDVVDRLAPWRHLLKNMNEDVGLDFSVEQIGWTSLSSSCGGFRSRIQLRGRLDPDAHIRLGYFARGGQQFVGIDDCPASHPSIRRLIRELSDERTRLQDVRRFRLQIIALFDEALYISLMSGHELTQKDVEALRARIEGIAGLEVYFAADNAQALQLMKWDEVNGVPFYVGGHSFCQSHREMNRLMQQYVVERVDNLSPDGVMDAYAGNGNFSLVLAEKSYQVTAIENSSVSIQALTKSAVEIGCDRKLKIFQSEVDLQRLGGHFSHNTLLIVDPPRQGMAEQASLVAKLPIEHLIYISCSMQAFTHDWQYLRADFLISGAHAFDMFPMQDEVEMVLSLKRR